MRVFEKAITAQAREALSYELGPSEESIRLLLSDSYPDLSMRPNADAMSKERGATSIIAYISGQFFCYFITILFKNYRFIKRIGVNNCHV